MVFRGLYGGIAETWLGDTNVRGLLIRHRKQGPFRRLPREVTGRRPRQQLHKYYKAKAADALILRFKSCNEDGTEHGNRTFRTTRTREVARRSELDYHLL